ncbi:hypothetical protein [Rhodoferax antarcticus]|uniref:Uncharacterized protein n=1 Tax=Rhodoferax antarcticus ANT.BR TaxID=1111071 RepID=A0A1Q8YIB2_9BURK|nr:hypothetical protein [Rhodoferax antarcticus]APW47989.1 hypothetical protein RA876_18395 [Rhodoferax antarcticus]OLP07804.1 hypothetical protein BLL52_0900 [Rhodoferax antarcticus ANT.BR]
MNWFERLTGFRETGYDDTRSKLKVEGRELHSLVNASSYGIGELELVSLDSLRERVKSAENSPGRLRVSVVSGDVRAMHSLPENAGALFQVASQFNLLEMVGPSVTPEHGVTRYEHDATQGPACAIAAGAATIYRNYFAPVGNALGQTQDRQLDGLADIGHALGEALGQPLENLWRMENGYAMCTRAGLDAITAHLGSLRQEKRDALCGLLRIGVHSDVEVTDAPGAPGQLVSQVFCSALPVAYGRTVAAAEHWKSFATLILLAAYEATLWAAVLNSERGASNVVLLTRLGGGAFGNNDDWIHAAMRRALEMARGYDLDVKLVSYGTPSREIVQMAKDFG